ncbi:MAG: 3'(2'),5'-bisphosphate nucleotidase CysQ family protein [Gemmatimonadota bacterium]
MTSRETGLRRELDVAVRLARAAGDAAMAFYGSASAEIKKGGSPVTEADHAANGVIVPGLREAFPDDAVLSEESRDDRSRLDARRVWIVDPLDGTKEFLAENGEFSIMIGLVVDGEPVVGVVYLPDGDTLYRAAAGAGAWVERDGRSERLEPAPARMDALRMVGSRSHADPLIDAMSDALGVADVRPSGSVGIKCALIAAGERDLYVHPVPYLKEWDTCAPEVILREAGGEVTDCRGDRLRYNKPDTRQPHGILGTGPGIHGRVLEIIAPLYHAAESERA